MALAHRPLLRVEAGLTEAEERKARGEHPLVASGPCGLLHLLLPGLVPSSSATVSPSTCEVPLRLAGWLALPLLRLSNHAVEKTLYYSAMVGPERLGAALDAALAKAGGITKAKAEPLAPAVLRLLLHRAAIALGAGPAGACFEVVPSDLYSLEEPLEAEGEAGAYVEFAEEDLAAPTHGPAADEYWGALTWGALVSEDGSLAGVAFLEAVLWPRFEEADYVAGFRKRLQPLVLQMIPNADGAPAARRTGHRGSGGGSGAGAGRPAPLSDGGRDLPRHGGGGAARGSSKRIACSSTYRDLASARVSSACRRSSSSSR